MNMHTWKRMFLYIQRKTKGDRLQMDFSVYCEDILTPFLEMIIDLHYKGDVDYENALRLGCAMCDIEQCLYERELINVQIDIVETILYDFELKLKRKG